eukprot:2289665-Prymnesium_polylepis.1
MSSIHIVREFVFTSYLHTNDVSTISRNIFTLGCTRVVAVVPPCPPLSRNVFTSHSGGHVPATFCMLRQLSGSAA